jgi:hypothetical protein
MKFVYVLVTVLVWGRVVSAQDFMPLAGGAFAFGAPYRVACPYTTNGVTAKIEVGFASDTNRVLPLVLRQFGTRVSTEMSLSDFIPSGDVKRTAPALGIDNIIVVMDTQKTKILFLFPKLSGFVEVEPPSDLTDGIRQMSRVRIDKVGLGTEWIDGSWCAKAQFRDPSSPRVTGTMWQRLDLHDFPMKIELSSKGDVMKIVTKTVDFSKPAMTYFEPLQGAKQCTNFAELILFAKKSSTSSAIPR